MKNRYCNHCGSDQPATLGQWVSQTGHINLGFQCDTCKGNVHDNKNRLWVPKAEAIKAGIDIEQLPIARWTCQQRCARCGKRGAQLHHWAPRHLFNDEADHWPTDYLCDDCHQQWHALVTPLMSEKGKAA